MKFRKWFGLWLVFVFVVIHTAHAGSPVWKVVRGDKQLFIGGTIHVLTPSDYPLPATFEKAYSQSSILVFETDIQLMKTPEVQKELLAKVIYSDGRSLKTVLNDRTFQALEQHLASRGIPVANMVNFKAGMVSVTLTMIELQRLGLVGTGVDEFYSLKALNDGKRLGNLESVDEQIAFLATMGNGREDDIIAYTLRDLRRLPELVQAIKDAWRKGQNQELEVLYLNPLKKEFPKVYDEIIVKRNKAWLPKIESMLESKDVEFILVGALHLVGDDGLLAELKTHGYHIRQP